jgi:hypothetical protein
VQPVISGRVFALVLGLSSIGVKAAHADGPCFHLEGVVSQPLEKELVAGPGDTQDSGKKGDGRVWARRTGKVGRPIERVLKFLLDPEHWKDPQVDELTVKRVAPGPNLAHLFVHSLVKPFPLVTVEWTDEWAYSLVGGTREAPEKVVISYQKVDGTSHITHFCGSMVLTKLDDTITEVFQYEESKITGRDEADQIEGLANLLKLLRTK